MHIILSSGPFTFNSIFNISCTSSYCFYNVFLPLPLVYLVLSLLELLSFSICFSILLLNWCRSSMLVYLIVKFGCAEQELTCFPRFACVLSIFSFSLISLFIPFISIRDSGVSLPSTLLLFLPLARIVLLLLSLTPLLLLLPPLLFPKLLILIVKLIGTNYWKALSLKSFC